MSVRAWVRYVDGAFVLTWRDWSTPTPTLHHRPLTFFERMLWRLLARTPKP